MPRTSGPSAGPRAAKASCQAARRSGAAATGSGPIGSAGCWWPDSSRQAPMEAARRCQSSRSSGCAGTGPRAVTAQGRACSAACSPMRSLRASISAAISVEVGAAFGVGDLGDLRGPRAGRERDQGAEPVPEAGVDDGGDVAGSGQVPLADRVGQDLRRGPGRPVRRRAASATAISPGGPARGGSRAARWPSAGPGTAAARAGVVSAAQIACRMARWSASARAWLRVWEAERCWPSRSSTPASTASASRRSRRRRRAGPPVRRCGGRSGPVRGPGAGPAPGRRASGTR